MDNEKLVKVMEGIKQNLHSALLAYSMNSKDKDIKTAVGKVDVLIELLRK